MARRGSKSLAARCEVGLRRQEVAKLFLRGWTQCQLAEHYGVTQSLISQDIKAVREEWKTEVTEDLMQLAEEMREVKREAWEGWERSCEDAETRTRKTERGRGKAKKEQQGIVSLFSPDGEEQEVQATVLDGVPTGDAADSHLRDKLGGEADDLVVLKQTTERHRKGQAGNPAFLDRVAWAIETRLKMLGALKGDAVNLQVNMIAPEQMRAFSNAFLAAAREVMPDPLMIERLQERTLELMPASLAQQSEPVPIQEADAESDGTMGAAEEATEPQAEEEV